MIAFAEGSFIGKIPRNIGIFLLGVGLILATFAIELHTKSKTIMETKSHLLRRSILMASLLLIANFALATRVGVYCFMNGPRLNANGDNNIQVSIRLNAQGEALLEVENLTGHIIYIDRRNSFSFVNGQAVQMFLPSVNTESHTVGRGIIYDDNSDIKWVDGESHTSSMTVYNQLIQAIPPHGISVVYAWRELPQRLHPDMIDIGKSGGWFCYNCKGRFADSQSSFKKGQVRQYSEYDTPLTLSALISYAIDNPHGSALRVNCTDFVTRIAIDSDSGISKDGLLRKQYAGLCFAFLSGKSTGTVIGECAAVAAVAAAIIVYAAEVKSMENSMPDFGF